MSSKAKAIVDDALSLSDLERAVIADALLASLHCPDAAIEAKQVAEIEDRLAAFDRGEIKEVTEEEFIADDDA